MFVVFFASIFLFCHRVPGALLLLRERPRPEATGLSHARDVYSPIDSCRRARNTPSRLSPLRLQCLNQPPCLGAFMTLWFVQAAHLIFLSFRPWFRI